jgi:hypothetical protein
MDPSHARGVGTEVNIDMQSTLICRELFVRKLDVYSCIVEAG